MITEIVLNKKYKVVSGAYTRKPLFIYDKWVFYEFNFGDSTGCSSCSVEDFKRDNEEIPEAPEEWFAVIYKLKGRNSRPNISDNLYRSKADFLNYCERKESDYEILKLKKVEL